MDFFSRQDAARKNTKLLVFYFAVAVLFIVASVYLTTLFIFNVGTTAKHAESAAAFDWWHWKIFLGAAGGTLAVIIGGSLIRTSQLSSGGSAVAESLGGRLVLANTRDPHERKLLNVVEEMAIASGTPIPKVYVMDAEDGINAFAAGHNLNDAAIGVTRGCITSLKRDELQGVIAHEFSHIINGDMRLNLRLMGLIFGIICLTVVGRVLIRARGSSRDRNPLPLLGLVLIVLGWIGVFFGQLIQAAVSRQREFLADAAAVQFTRNPDGIGGALKKIAVAHAGATIADAHAAEASHMFFGSSKRRTRGSLFATHPPLEDRIRAIEPSWDGVFPRFTPAPVEETTPKTKTAPKSAMPPIIPGFPGGAGGLGAAAAAIQTASVLPNLGNPTEQHLRYAEALREALPDSIREAAHEPQQAALLLYGLLLSDESGLRAAQRQELVNAIGPDQDAQLTTLLPDLMSIGQRARLPLVNLALPALRQLSREEFEHFEATLQWLMESDQQIVLFEFVLQKIVQRQLQPHFRPTRPHPTQYYAAAPLAPDATVLLSALAYAGSTVPEEISRAFSAGAPLFRAGATELQLLPAPECNLERINQALDRLDQAAPQIKKNLIAACAQVIGADGVIQETEAELLRGIAETVDCPLPPFIAAT